MLSEMVERIRRRRPLVHCITNYVTANDCANLLLAAGASPIMADDPGEVEEVVSISDALVLNMGTPNPNKLKAIQIAGKRANELEIPVVLDPVGVAVSTMRRNEALKILKEIRVSVIRGNASEICSLMLEKGMGGGLDASGCENLAELQALAGQFSDQYGCVTVMTGAADIVTDGRMGFLVHNGDEMMRRVTGAGCQLSALMGAYAAVGKDELLTASLAAACSMGICGERAAGRAHGNAGFRNELIDAMYQLNTSDWEEMARYEEYPGNAQALCCD